MRFEIIPIAICKANIKNKKCELVDDCCDCVVMEKIGCVYEYVTERIWDER